MINAPFKPKLNSLLDTSYFPCEDLDQTDSEAKWRAETAALSKDHAAEMNLPFIGYTFKPFSYKAN